jgi:hypothetical protein
VYRLVSHSPPAAADFSTHAELGRMLKAPPCLRVGLSVFRTLDDALHQHELLPFLGNRVAKAELNSTHGKTKLTTGKQPTHTTWWPYGGVERASPFIIVKVLVLP